ncbi:MAG: hypothetical protein Q4F41_09470 [Eubacteriales bacterium]|nr:hypothetical protein [Eubacteriales bacterium]
MKEYEAVWEIFNQCANNQMRDVFFEELTLDDPEEYLRTKFKGKEVTWEKTLLEDGTLIFDIVTSGIRQRYTFTEI